MIFLEIWKEYKVREVRKKKKVGKRDEAVVMRRRFVREKREDNETIAQELKRERSADGERNREARYSKRRVSGN